MPKPENARVRAEVRVVTPREAAHLRLTCHFSQQRQISDTNVKRLAGEMERGRFIQGTGIYFASLPDGTLLIMNGNHTLEAVVKSGISQMLVFIYVEVADEAEAAQLYGTFDIHKTRSWIDALKAIGADKDIAMPTKVMPAVGLILQGFVPSKVNLEAVYSRHARFEAMKHYKEAAALFHAALSGCPSLHRNVLARAGVMSIALETLRYQPVKAVEFWETMAQDDGLSIGDPRKSLLRFLINTKAEGGRAAGVWSKAAMLGWNAWYRGDKLHLIQPGKVSAIALLGTPNGTTRTAANVARPKRPHQPPDAGGVEREPPRQPKGGGGAQQAIRFDADDVCGQSPLTETGMAATPSGITPVTYLKR